MTAIVTNNFRLNAAKKFVSDVRNEYPEFYDNDAYTTPDNQNAYYLFVGRSEEWDDDTNPDNPYDNTYSYRTDAWQRMTALKQLTSGDITFAVQRYQWILGTSYDEYDDRDDALNTKKYYVISDNNNVYLCLKSGGTSTKNPDVGTTENGIIDFRSDDGYIWKYLFTVSSIDSTKFLTSAFIPVKYIESAPGDGADTATVDQYNVQQNAVDGAIYNIVVTARGSGYDSGNPPTITIEGNGTGAAGTVVVDENGQVEGITMTNFGSGYDYARVVFSSGAATARPVVGPKGGFGADPRNDLKSHYVTLNTSLVYAEGGGDFIVGNDFRQIGVIRNPYNYNTTTVSTAETLSATKKITLVDTSGSFTADQVIEGTDSGAKAIVDHYDSAAGVIRYHQTDETGYEPFTTDDEIADEGDTSGVAVDSLSNPEVEPFSGEVVFLENRTPVNRQSDQIETIKLVLEF